MRRHGHTAHWGSCIDADEFERADVIVNQYLHEEATIRQWEHWRDGGKKLLVWECDDDITTVHNVTSSGSAYDNPETLPRMIRGIQASHLVTVTTPRLKEVLAPYNSNIVVLPNRIPARLLTEPTTPPTDFTISWSASPSHQQDAQEFFPALERFYRKFPDTVLRLYGPDQRPIGIPSWWRVETMGWEKQTYRYLQSLNGTVGVAPLVRRSTFNKAKSGIKALEYLARGIIPIAQDYPQYRGINGVKTASTTAEWVDALSAVRRSSPAQLELRQDAGRCVASDHTIERHIHSWLDFYQEGLDSL